MTLSPDRLRRPLAALGSLLAVGLAAAVVAAVAFGLLARGVAGGATQEVDEAVVRWFLELSNPVFDVLALLGAALGSAIALWIVLIAGTVVFWRKRRLASVVVLWASLVGGYVLNPVLKAFFARPRPSLRAGDLELLGWTFAFPTSPSFPSGHAVTSVVVFGTLAYLVLRLEPTRRMRRWTLAGAVGLIVLIGTTRVYLGVHYPSDVLAGVLAGFVWTAASALSVEAMGRSARLRAYWARRSSR
jgi:undecaprenyl-diphosphatase